MVLFFLRVLQTRAWQVSASDDGSFSVLLLCWSPSGPWILVVSEANSPAQLLYPSLRSRWQFRHSEVLPCPYPTASGNLLPDASAPRQSLPKSLPTPFGKCRYSLHNCPSHSATVLESIQLLIAYHIVGTWSLSWRKLGRTCKNQTWETSRRPDDQDQQS